MWKRVLWDVLCLVVLFFAPWWATLALGIVGTIFFSWYIEIIFLGVLYDVLFGGITGTWYYHMIHTGIFTLPLIVSEFVKTKINIK